MLNVSQVGYQMILFCRDQEPTVMKEQEWGQGRTIVLGVGVKMSALSIPDALTEYVCQCGLHILALQSPSGRLESLKEV